MNEVARKLALSNEVEAKASLRSLRFETFSIVFCLLPQSAEGTTPYLIPKSCYNVEMQSGI